MLSVKVHWGVGFKQKQWLSEVVFWNNIHIQIYNWKKCALCQSKLSGGLQAETMASRRNFSKQYTRSNIQLNEVCALWKYSEWWASIRSNGFRKKFFKTLYTFKLTIEQICALWKSSEWWASIRSNGFQTKFFETLYTFKNTIEQTMLSVKVHWGVGLKQKHWLAEEVFRNILHIQTYNWTKYALCECTLSGGLQAEAIAFRRIFSKHYTHSNTQLNKLCALWKYTESWVSSRSKGSRRSSSKNYRHSNIKLNKVCGLLKHTECWASSRSNGFQKKFFESFYTSKQTIEESMRSVKVQWVVGLKQKQWLSEEVFQNITHIQIYN